MTDNEDVEVPIENNVIVEEVKETDESMQKPKVKKPRSEKQIEALKKAHAVRQANFAEKKRLIQLEKEERESRMKEIKKEEEEQADDEEEDDEEAPIVKAKPKAKPRKKVKKAPKVVFEDSDSDEDQEIIIRKVRKNKKIEKVEPTPRPTSPINIPIVPKENKKMTSISEVEENIIEEQKKYSHSEILRMMGM